MKANERKSVPFWKKIIIFLITFILFIIQLGMAGATVWAYYLLASNAYQGIFGLLFGLSYAVGIIYVLFIISRPISISYKLTWAILILAVPLPFCVLYTTNSTVRKLSRSHHDKIKAELQDVFSNITGDSFEYNNSRDANFVNVLQSSTYAPLYKGCNIEFFSDARDKHFKMLEDLKTAKNYILLEYFIINDGKCFDAIYEILKEKGEAGVHIYVLYDDVGSKSFLTQKIEHRLAQIPNALASKFHPVTLSISPTINYRDHRKICVIDGRVAYCGGDNLADEYIHEMERFGFWRDNACRYEGEVVETFKRLFVEMWYAIRKEKLFLDQPILSYERQPGYVIAFGDGPANVQNPGYDLFYSLISSAHKYAFISTPYFIIDDAMIQTMCVKAKSGVEVCLLMPGIPDKKTANYMGRANYRKLLLSGVKIYEFTPGFNHAKNVIIDDEYAFCGTINMDYRSLFLHYECGALLMHHQEIEKMKEDYLSALGKSKQITYADWKASPTYQKFIAFILNIFAPFF